MKHDKLLELAETVKGLYEQGFSCDMVFHFTPDSNHAPSQVSEMNLKEICKVILNSRMDGFSLVSKQEQGQTSLHVWKHELQGFEVEGEKIKVHVDSPTLPVWEVPWGIHIK